MTLKQAIGILLNHVGTINLILPVFFLFFQNVFFSKMVNIPISGCSRWHRNPFTTTCNVTMVTGYVPCLRRVCVVAMVTGDSPRVSARPSPWSASPRRASGRSPSRGFESPAAVCRSCRPSSRRWISVNEIVINRYNRFDPNHHRCRHTLSLPWISLQL